MRYLKKMLRIFRVFVATRKHRIKPINRSLIAKWSSPSIPTQENKGTKLTWIGHSTFLIQVNGANIITDPIFFDLPMGLKRMLPPGIPPQYLPRIDAILISHNHRDHMDERSLRLLKDYNPLILVPHGTKKWFEKKDFKNVREYDWHEQESFSLRGIPFSFSFLPAKHWSCRTPFDLNKSVWGSWMIEYNNKKIYFAGDSGASPLFKEIGQEYGPIDIALMPLGPSEPRALMKATHMSSEEAVDTFIDLNARHFIPMHWGTYQTGCDTFEGPIEQLQTAWQERSAVLQKKTLHIVKCGEQLELLQEITFTPARKAAFYDQEQTTKNEQLQI
jgi:L-ascorbate metabolism protein UlaG (beta-lactamase superfamily)